jgi:hypothetical protein
MGALDMDRLPMILFGHAAFQYLNAACELGLLDLLAGRGPLTAEQIRSELDLAERAGDILLLGCTSLGLIEFDGSWYRLAAQIMDLIKRGIWSHIRNTVTFEQHIVYEGQADFAESLRQNTNVELRRIPGEGGDLHRRLAQIPRLEKIFYRYMRSWSQLTVYFASLPAEDGMIYPWRQHETSLRAAGFTELERITCPAWAPHGILIGTKPDS